MPQITKSTALRFGDFAGGSYGEKMAAARAIARSGGFRNPLQPLQQAIVRFHRDGENPLALTSGLRASRIQKPDLVGAFEAYLRWVGLRGYGWEPLDGPRLWRSPGMTVSAQGDVGLLFKGKRYIVKHYVRRDDPIGLRRAENVLHLMSSVYADEVRAGAKVAVLDVWREDLRVSSQIPAGGYETFMRAEAASCHDLVEALLARRRDVV